MKLISFRTFTLLLLKWRALKKVFLVLKSEFLFPETISPLTPSSIPFSVWI